jgi:uncharacterized protein YdeI (BOF family)
MRRLLVSIAVIALVSATAVVLAQGGFKKISEILTGYEETAGTQPCPAPPATISGTITAADVTNLANERGISAGELDELIAAIRAGATYVNVHSTRWPGGEIRSQIDGNSGHDH